MILIPRRRVGHRVFLVSQGAPHDDQLAEAALETAELELAGAFVEVGDFMPGEQGIRLGGGRRASAVTAYREHEPDQGYGRSAHVNLTGVSE